MTTLQQSAAPGAALTVKRRRGTRAMDEHRPYVVRYIQVPVVRCYGCLHEWPIKVDGQGRAQWPVKCASCGSTKWDRVHKGDGKDGKDGKG